MTNNCDLHGAFTYIKNDVKYCAHCNEEVKAKPMTQKTAIMQLIEKLIANKENYHPMSYGHFMTELTNGLATEKGQIVNAYHLGVSDCADNPNTTKTGEQFYNETYGQYNHSPEKKDLVKRNSFLIFIR